MTLHEWADNSGDEGHMRLSRRLSEKVPKIAKPKVIYERMERFGEELGEDFISRRKIVTVSWQGPKDEFLDLELLPGGEAEWFYVRGKETPIIGYEPVEHLPSSRTFMARLRRFSA